MAETRQQHDTIGHAIHVLESKATDADFKIKELQHRVDHFGDNLTLSSNQIVVESAIGFSKRPSSLFDVLKQCHETFSGINTTILKYGSDIAAHAAAIETKADATVALTVETLSNKMDSVQTHLKKEEKQGVNVSDMQTDMQHMIIIS